MARQGMCERLPISLQQRYDLEVDRDRLADTLDEVHPLMGT
jgi:hypothetical protein